jgi:hypothetical protein
VQVERDGQIKARVVLERKHPDLAAFVVVPAAKVAPWKLAATTTVEATLDGLPLGRRSLHRWDEDRWFVELRREHLESLGKTVGDRATLVLSLASTALPPELEALIRDDAEAGARWRALTDAQRRMLREEILAAKSSSARERRSRRALLPEPCPPAPRVKGLTPEAREVLVKIVGRRLPGRTCGPYTDVRVALAQKVGCDEGEPVPADRRQVSWETRIEVREREGVTAFRGPAVNGPPRERFLYLSWIGRKGRAAPAMFRRAKLRLDAVPASVLSKALRSGVLVGRLELTAADGMPVCASVRPPAITWSA